MDKAEEWNEEPSPRFRKWKSLSKATVFYAEMAYEGSGI